MTDKSEVKKDQLIADLIAVRTNILAAVTDVQDDKQDRVFLGSWSLKDILAHLTGWDFSMMQAIEAVRAGELPTYYSYLDHDWQSYNTRLVDEYKRDDFSDLLSLVKQSHTRLIEFVGAIPAEVFEKDHGVRYKGDLVTIARLLQAELNDERVHLQQIKDFLAKEAGK